MLSDAWMHDDRNSDDNKQPEDIQPIDLDDAYAQEYFHKFEVNSDYDRNAYDASYHSVRTVRKYCRERGLPFLRQNGYQQPARNVKDACTCRKRCFAKFPEDVRTKLLSNLLELSAEGQNTFLVCHIEPRPAQNPNLEKRKKSVRNYYLPSNSGRIKVCKVMFANTFDLSGKKIRNLTIKAESGAYDNLLSELIPVKEIPINAGEENDAGSDVEEIDGSHDEEDNESEQSEDSDDSDIELPSVSIYKENENPADSEPLLSEAFLDRYFHQLYEIDPMQKEATSSNTNWNLSASLDDTPLEPCSCVVYHCNRWLTNDFRRMIYRRYIKLSHTKQIQFLQDHTRRILKKRAKKDLSRRQYSQLYFIPTVSGHIRVCKVMLLSTFKITDYQLRELIEKKGASATSKEKSNIPKEETNDNKRRVSSMFAFDPNLKDPLAMEEKEVLINKKRKSSCTSDTNSTKTDTEDTHSIVSEKDDNSAKRKTKTAKPKLSSKPDPPKAELDDAFLDEYFARFRSNDQSIESFENSDKEAVPPPCSCQKKCASAYPDDSRLKIFTRFFSLSPINQQRFLYRHIQIHKVHGSVTRRQKMWSFYLPSKTGLVKVCIIMFINLFQSTEKKIRNLVKRKHLRDSPNECMQAQNADDVQAGSSNSCVLPTDDVEDEVTDTEDVTNDLQTADASPIHLTQSEEYANDMITNVTNDNDDDDDVDDVEIKYSYELMNTQPNNEYYSNNTDVGDGMETDGQCYSIPVVPEIDEDFLDEYFVQYEVIGDQEKLNGRKIKPMTKKDANDEHIVMEPCSCVNFKCFTWLTDDLRQKIYGRFLRLSPLGQKIFMARHIRKENKKRKNKKVTRRNYSMFYFMPTKRGQFKVCKVMFMNTFKVTDKKIRSLLGSDCYEMAKQETDVEPNEIETGVDSSFIHSLSSNDDVQSTDTEDALGYVRLPNTTPTQFNQTDELDSQYAGDDDIEVEYSFESFKTEPQDEHDNDTTDQRDTAIQSPIDKSVPVIDEDFIQQYFVLFERFGNQEQMHGQNNVKPMIRKSANGNYIVMEPCNCVNFVCYTWLTDDLQQKLYSKFVHLPPLGQKYFIARHVTKQHKKRPRGRIKINRRTYTMFYFIPTKKGPMKVCKVMFMNTFNVTDKCIRTILGSDFYDMAIQETPIESNTIDTGVDNSFIQGLSGNELAHITDTEDAFIGTPPFVQLSDTIPTHVNQIEEYDNDYASNDDAGDEFLGTDDSIDNSAFVNSSGTTPAQLNQSEEHCNDYGSDDEVTKYSIEPFNRKSRNENDINYPDRDMNESLPIIPETDENFLEQYFEHFESNVDYHKSINKRKAKPMARKGAIDNNIIMEPCNCAVFRCFTWLTNEMRQKLYNKFVQLSPLGQKYFMIRHIRKEHRRRPAKNIIGSRRTCSMFYFVPTQKGQMKVCKIMFMNTFRVTDKGIRILMERAHYEAPQETAAGLIEANGIDDNCSREEAPGTDTIDIPEQNHSTITAVELDEVFLNGYFQGLLSTTPYNKHTSSTFEGPNTLEPACSCNQYCYIKFPDHLRQMILNQYSQLPQNYQWHFLKCHIQIESGQHRKEIEARKKVTYHCYLPSNAGRINICQVMFRHTFSLGYEQFRAIVLGKCSTARLNSIQIQDGVLATATHRHPLAVPKNANVNFTQSGAVKDDFPVRIKIENEYGEASSNFDGKYSGTKVDFRNVEVKQEEDD